MVAKRLSLANRRKTVGHTQESLAALLGVERSTVVRWESGETEPLPWCRPKLAEALVLSLDALDDLLTTLDDIPTQHSDALLLSLLGTMSAAQIGTLMERFAAMDIASRRAVLQELTLLSGAALLEPVRRWLARALTVTPLITPDSVSNDSLDALEKAVVLFRRWDASGMGGLRRKAVVGQLNAVAETLNESHSPRVRKRLFHITAELAQLAGWMAYDQGLPGVAQRYYLLGLSACHEARSPTLAAKILGDMAQLARTYGYHEDSLDLIRAGLYILPRYDSALVRTELLGLESRAHAISGSQAAAVRSTDACLESWQDAKSEAAPDWLHYMKQGAEVDCLIANTYIELALRLNSSGQTSRHAEQAELYIISAHRTRAHGYDRSRILDEVRLANVRLAQDDLPESVNVAQSALELAASTSSTFVCDSLLRFHTELTARHPGNVHIIPFRDQLHDYVKRVAPHKEGDLAST